MKGGKDDFYLYRSDGLLYAYLSFANDDDLALSAPEDESSGYVFPQTYALGPRAK